MILSVQLAWGMTTRCPELKKTGRPVYSPPLLTSAFVDLSRHGVLGAALPAMIDQRLHALSGHPAGAADVGDLRRRLDRPLLLHDAGAVCELRLREQGFELCVHANRQEEAGSIHTEPAASETEFVHRLSHRLGGALVVAVGVAAVEIQPREGQPYCPSRRGAPRRPDQPRAAPPASAESSSRRCGTPIGSRCSPGRARATRRGRVPPWWRAPGPGAVGTLLR